MTPTRLALFFTAVGAMLAFAASAGAAPLVVSGNYDGESVSVYDAQTHAQVGATIPLASEASAVAIVPGGRAFVAEYHEDAVAVIEPRTAKFVTRIPVGNSPEYIAVSPDGKTAYVANTGEAAVTVIDTATDTVTGSIPLGGDPYTIAFSPSGTFAYVSVEDEVLERIDTATRQVVGQPIEVGEDPVTIAFAPDGATAYVAEESSEQVSIVDTASNQTIGNIPLPGMDPWGVAVSADGTKLYVSNEETVGTVLVFSTQTRQMIGTPIPAGDDPYEIALTPDGKTLWVSAYRSEELIPIDTATNTAGTPIAVTGEGPWQLAITPDLSPTASFTAPSAYPGVPATFNGTASDPDGSVLSYGWSFGDGSTASGAAVTHTYAAAGTYDAELSAVDAEGCGKARVFTGRTALCSGSTPAVHPVAVTAPPIVCSGRFTIGRVIPNRKNGTARMQLKLPAAGSIYLSGKKVHAVSRKLKKAGSTFITIHPRVQLNKQLKKTHRASVKVRVAFTPTSCGSPRTLNSSLTLLRAPRKKH